MNTPKLTQSTTQHYKPAKSNIFYVKKFVITFCNIYITIIILTYTINSKCVDS